MAQFNRSRTVVASSTIAVLALSVSVVSTRPARAQDAAIPVDGLELWVKADGPMKVSGAQVTEWSDASGKGNHAVHDTFGAAIPTLAMANGKPTLHFSGGYTGFHFTKINTVRTVFAVLSKDSKSCLPTLPNYGTPAKFWLGGNANPTYFHPEHGCAIYNSNLSEASPNLVNGKTYLNGKLVEGRTTRFPFELGLLSIVAKADVAADTIARDRTFNDRSWQGDISEILIYSRALDDATRVSVENILSRKYAIGQPSGGSGGSGGAAAGGGANGGSAGLGGGPASAGGTSGSAGNDINNAGAGNTAGGSAGTTASAGTTSAAGMTSSPESMSGGAGAGTGGATTGAGGDHAGGSASDDSSCAMGRRHDTEGSRPLALALAVTAVLIARRRRAR